MKAILLIISLLGFSSALRRDLFGTSTFYEWIQSLNVSKIVADELNEFPNGNNGTCKAVQLTGVFRHGIDFPKRKDMVKFETMHRAFKNSIVDKYTAIKQWQLKFGLDMADHLAPAGAAQHRGIGATFAKRLKTLFLKGRDSTQFISSYQQRAKASATNFHVGAEHILSGNTNASDITIKVDDKITRFGYDCQRFIKTVLDNNTARVEEKTFDRGRLIANVTQRVNTELFGGDLVFLDFDTIQDLMKLCAREMGFYGSSPWCSLFTDWELEVQEFEQDLYRYYAYGYGYKINVEQTCPLFVDMFNNLDEFVSPRGPHGNNDKRMLKLIFAHSATVIPLTSALGLFKDKIPPRADNFETQKNRQYYISRIAPAAANIAMVMYECTTPTRATTSKGDFSSHYAVKLFSNQYEKEFPGCNTKMCPYTFIRNKYSHYIDHCHGDEICKLPTDPGIVG